jgi:L-iditol 2-dehydrogenase
MVEPLAVAVHAIGRTAGVAGKRVLVLGAGTIGNLVAQACGALGAEAVLITDIQAYKLDKARECGIRAVDTGVAALGEALIAEFGPAKADLTFECVGAPATAAQAIDNARKGTTIVIVGVFGDKPETNLGFVQDRELHIAGSAMYKKEDFQLAIELARSGKIQLLPLVTHRFPFAEYSRAYATIDQSGGRYMKVLIELD